MVDIKDYLQKESILFLESKNKDSALNSIIANAENVGLIFKVDSFKKAIFEREEVMSTGIGYGLAIPHAKCEFIDKFFISIGIHKEGLFWESIDNKPVHVVFLIGGPMEQSVYLQILSKLMRAMKSPKNRELLFTANSAEDVLAIF